MHVLDGLRPAVLLDVDGTLIDSNYLHTLAWSRAFRDAGEWAPMNAIHRLIGMGGDQLVEELLGHPCRDASDARARYYRELFGDIRPFPGAVEFVTKVHEAGLAVVLATSSPEPELAQARRVLGLDDVIDSQISSADVERAKPAPDVFRRRDGVRSDRSSPGLDGRGQRVGRRGRDRRGRRVRRS